MRNKEIVNPTKKKTSFNCHLLVKKSMLSYRCLFSYKERKLHFLDLIKCPLYQEPYKGVSVTSFDKHWLFLRRFPYYRGVYNSQVSARLATVTCILMYKVRNGLCFKLICDLFTTQWSSYNLWTDRCSLAPWKGIRNPEIFSWGIWTPALWNPEPERIQIPHFIRIWNPSSTDKNSGI